MGDRAGRLGSLVVLAALLGVAGLIAAGSFELLSRPVVESHSVPAGPSNDMTVTFVAEKSRLLKRPISRLVMIEGQGAYRDHNKWIPGHAPEQWNGQEDVLVSDAGGIRRCGHAVFRQLWSFERTDMKDMGSLLRQVAAETRDQELVRFLRQHQANR